MNFGKRVAFLAALAILAAAALGGTTDRSAADTAREGAATKAGRLVAFRSCGDLLDYAKSQATRFVGPYGLGGQVPLTGLPAATAREAAPKQGVDYSGTNVQEEGVDEPDIVKTNGTTLFAIANGKLSAVDVSEAKPRLLDTLKLDAGLSHELLLHGDRLLLLSRGGYWAEPLPAIAARIRPYAPAQSVLAEIDVSNPKALRVVRTLTLDGAYVAARLVGGVARIVATSQVPSALPFAQPKDGTKEELAAAGQRNRAVVASSRVGSWLPSYRIARPGTKTTKKRALVQCRNVRRPIAFSGLGLLTVLTIDLAKGLEPVDSVAVMTDARIVYASPESLYVATERWADRPSPDKPTQEKDGVTTAIHKFDISSPARTQYRGSGQVSGYLLSQWSLSEYRGVLRVVSTESPAWWGPGGETESFLTTLRQQDGALVQAGRIGELGKGERVYAVRFVGDVGYVVTFRQIDPLYTLDLAVPERPRVVRRAEDPRLLGVPASDRRRPAARHRPGYERRRPPDRHAAVALRRLGSPEADPAAHRAARPGLVRGGVRPPRVPLLAENRARRRSVRAASRRLPRRPRARDRRRRADRARGGKALLHAWDPALAGRPQRRAHGLRLRRQVEQPRHAGRAGLGRVPAARAA